MNIDELKRLELRGKIYVELHSIPESNEPFRYNVEEIMPQREVITLRITREQILSQDISYLQSILNRYEDEISIDYRLRYIDPDTDKEYFRGSDLYNYFTVDGNIIFVGTYLPIM